MAYLYRHIRLDKQEVFYLGIGSDENYERANSTNNRNQYWHNIAKNGYEVEIVLDNLTWEEACEKEKELIKLYGRKDLNEGTLVNMTDGGEGILGLKHTEETVKKIVENNTKKVECPHCNKIGGYVVMRRYHFDNCKVLTGKDKHVGHSISEETKKKIGKANSISHKGKKKSEEWVNLMKVRNKGNKYCLGHKLTIEHKEKISLSLLGKKHSEETKKRLSVSSKGKQKAKVECPHCKLIGGINNMKRYHFNNCKKKI
jgi:hypothetical protein